jgi:hypothetical protein
MSLFIQLEPRAPLGGAEEKRWCPTAVTGKAGREGPGVGTDSTKIGRAWITGASVWLGGALGSLENLGRRVLSYRSHERGREGGIQGRQGAGRVEIIASSV